MLKIAAGFFLFSLLCLFTHYTTGAEVQTGFKMWFKILGAGGLLFCALDWIFDRENAPKKENLE